MSKMGRAVEWVQDNGLEGNPDALKMYIKHLKQQEVKPDTNNNSVNQIEENIEDRK
jgi:hypothetical protein